MPAVRSLIAAHNRGDRASLQALAVALAATVDDTPLLPVEPVALMEAVEDDPQDRAGTWQEVRAARDNGDLSAAEYDYLAAAVEALTLEDRDGD